MKKKLICFRHRVYELAASEKNRMYLLLCKYYSNISLDQFYKDLDKKDHVFLLREKSTMAIKGFSTIVQLEVEINGHMKRGFFSGDTVVEKEYWGERVLGINFLKFLFLQKLRNPFQPLYWFLISKGYKTYLLMANNFTEHYPCYEKKTPSSLKQVIDCFGWELYGESYNQRLGLVRHRQGVIKDSLKDNIAPITEEMLERNKRISFFAEKNPSWKQGDELACLATMTLLMPFSYQWKTIKKRMKTNKILRVVREL